MSTPSPSATPTAILAAGGIVIAQQADAVKIALVKRHRYPGEIALPKGKLNAHEEPSDTAIREVREETGCIVRTRELAGTTHYRVKGVPKCVFYFVMELLGEDPGGPSDRNEIESVEWYEPRAAVAALTHQEDRDLISAVFGITRGV
jgi:8-oxo-dGTP diphosphatase